jgi:hypothetical protein
LDVYDALIAYWLGNQSHAPLICGSDNLYIDTYASTAAKAFWLEERYFSTLADMLKRLLGIK